MTNRERGELFDRLLDQNIEIAFMFHVSSGQFGVLATPPE